MKTKAEDVKLGDRVRFDGLQTVWTIASKRRTRSKKIVFTIVFENEGVIGKGTTRALPLDFELEVVE